MNTCNASDDVVDLVELVPDLQRHRREQHVQRVMIRMAVVRRFYYCVYYRPHADRVQVIAVFHPSRDPAIWKGRV